MDINALVARAGSLAQSDKASAIELYQQVLKQAPDHLPSHNALQRLNAPECLSELMRINGIIDERDDIYSFIVNSGSTADPIRIYLSDGWRTLSELMVVLEKYGSPLLAVDSVLELASGFGRFTRHLVKALPGRVTCSDVLPGSVDFLREQFGVKGFYSSAVPEDIAFEGCYDLIFVLSLFTHLPVDRWERWLTVLKGQLNPGGTIVFTVHNEDFGRSQGVRYDPHGVRFIPTSESPSIGEADYGTTFTTQTVVEKVVQRVFGAGYETGIEPIAFWIGQDAVVIKQRT